MSKRIIVMFAVIALSAVFLVSTVYASATEKEVNINPVSIYSSIGQANMRMYMLEGLSMLELKVWMDNIFMVPGWVYEVWLVDTESGYKLSLGTFVPTPGGKALFESDMSMANPAIYDSIVITKGPMNDINPEFHTAIAEGMIPNSIADVVTMHATLKGRYEVPGTTSKAKGYGTFTVDTVANTVSYNIVHMWLEGFETAAHIHGFAPMGMSSPALHPLPGGTTKIGTWNYGGLAADEEKILAGLTYANIHSHLFPDGEIRGQILFDL